MREVILHKGEVFEKVFLNEPEVDLHIVQEAGSRVKIHLINVQRDDVQCTKVLQNGQLFIIREGVMYNAQGAVVK